MTTKNNSENITEMIERSLLNRKGTENNRETLTKSFGYPITDCVSFIEAVKQKFGYSTTEETKEAISHNNVLIKLMFTIA